MNNVLTAVGYLRCSTDEQGATSIPQQKLAIENWAKANKYFIKDWFSDEGKSGTSFTARPAFTRLAKTIEGDHDFKYVIAYDESRWGRALNPRENSYWKMHFEMHNVKVRLVHSSSKNENNIGSYVMEVVESAEASEFSKKIARNTLRGMLSEQQKGYSRGGTAPYGYKRIAVNLQSGERRALRDGVWSVTKQEKVVWELGDVLEIDTVKRIFDMKSKGMGFVAIADVLSREKIPPPRRGRWRNADTKWSGGTVRTIVRNQAYTGDRVYNRSSYSKFVAQEKGREEAFKWANDESEWIIYPNAHPAIISREIYSQANQKSTEIHSVKPNQHLYKSPFLLTGLIKCSRCHYNYQGSRNKSRGKAYYIDGGVVNKGKSVCSWHSIRKDELEGFVIRSVKETLLTEGMKKRIEASVRELYMSGLEGAESEKKTLQLRLENIQARIGNLLAVLEKGGSFGSVNARLQELELEKKEVEDKLRAEESMVLSQEAGGRITEAVTGFLQGFEQRFKDAPIMEQKELLRKVVEKIEVDRCTGSVRCYIRRIPMVEEVQVIEKQRKDDWVLSVAPTGIEPVF